jgi:hypothetical protein
LGKGLYPAVPSVATVRRRAFAAAVALACIVALAVAPLPVSAHINDVTAGPQVSANGTVVVETAYVAGDAWVALYADDGGERGELLAADRLRGAGFRTDLAVAIDDERWADWAAGEARPVHVALHSDDGSDGFDREEDTVLTAFGREAADRFTLERGSRAYVGSAAFSPGTTDDGSVRVRTVQLPADGYVVARNVTNPGDDDETAAEPVGATALDAGSHGNVTVGLNESFYEDLGSRARVAFTLYGNDGDGGFGPGDEPVRAGEDAVTTFVYVNRTGDGGESTATGTGDDGGGAQVTTATGDGTGDDGVVTTATTSPAAGGSSPTDDGTERTSTDGQPGFGALAAVSAVAAGLVAAALRRRS